MTDERDEEVSFREIAERFLKPLVPHPDDVVVMEQVSSSRVALEASVHVDDTGRVIGKGGDTIRALRHLIEAAGQRRGVTVTFDLKDA